jgi:hypothetical protein
LGTEEYSSDPTVTVYPNPFNNSTTLTYSLTTASEVEISLFDVLSCEISILASSPQQAGKHSINISSEKYNLSKGIYFCKLSIDKRNLSVKMIVY